MSKRDLLYIGAGAGPRRDAFAAAWRDATGAPPDCLSYAEIAAEPERAKARAASARYLRFDSPDRDPASLAAVLARGRDDTEAQGFATLPSDSADPLMRGAIGSPAQIAFGFAGYAADLIAASAASASITVNDLATSFDKTATLARLGAASVSVPESLGNPENFDDVRTATASAPRAFLKLRHGSSAAGMMALERRGRHWRAITTAFENEAGELCATRAVRTLRDEREIAHIIDQLAPFGLHLERWIEKYEQAGQGCDLRLVPGTPPFVCVRMSRSPMTNLHLGAARGDPDVLRRKLGEAVWQSGLAFAGQAARAFPGLDSPGIDLAFRADGRRATVFEINAFGAFVKDSADGPCIPYQREAKRLAAMLDSAREAAA